MKTNAVIFMFHVHRTPLGARERNEHTNLATSHVGTVRTLYTIPTTYKGTPAHQAIFLVPPCCSYDTTTEVKFTV